MKTVQKHIRKTLFVIFLSIFIPLFAIASIIFLVKLATYTAIIELSLLEMAKLFLFMLPELLFFTLPISFFVALVLSLHKLSNDNEAVVLFALGVEPKTILKIVFSPALFLSLILVFDFFVLFPHAKILSSNFISYKKGEAKFNLSASEFGHKFGDWLLYIGKDNLNETYSNVVLFNKNQNEEIFVGAKEAKILNDGGVLRLRLTSGEGYGYSKKKFTQINFDSMYINDTMKTDQNRYQTPIDYWFFDENSAKKRKMFVFNFLFALFPVLSLFLAPSMAIVHARHQKTKIYLFLFLSIIIYGSLSIALQMVLSYFAIPLLMAVWLLVTYILYRKTIVAKF